MFFLKAFLSNSVKQSLQSKDVLAVFDMTRARQPNIPPEPAVPLLLVSFEFGKLSLFKPCGGWWPKHLSMSAFLKSSTSCPDVGTNLAAYQPADQFLF